MTCPKCQQAVAPVDLFCGFCGARIAGPVTLAGRPAGSGAAARVGAARPTAVGAAVGAVVVKTPPSEPSVGDALGSPVEIEQPAVGERAGGGSAGAAAGVEPDADPSAWLADVRPAGFFMRTAASLVDSVLLAAWSGITFSFVIGQTMAARLAAAPAQKLDDISTLALLATAPWAVALWLVIVVAYLVSFVAIEGATPGKMLLGLRVIRPDGAGVGWGRAALREVAGKALSAAVVGIGYLMTAFGSKRGLHDLVAGTLVVRMPNHRMPDRA